MKKVLKKFCGGRVVAVLMTVLMVMGAIAPSLADTIRKDGLEVTITTDKESYKAGEEIKVTVAVKNTGRENINNVMVELQIPEGIELAEGSDSQVIIGSVKAGSEKTEEVVCKATEDVNTGDDKPVSGGIVVTDPVVEEGAPNVNFAGSTDEVKKQVPLTQEEQEAVANGENVNVWLEIKPVTPSDEERTLIEAKKGDYIIGAYIDMSMFKKVGNNAQVPVPQLNGKIKVSIVIPESLRNTDSSIERTYMIIHYHSTNAEAEALTGTYDETNYTYTMETDSFSTYAISYKDSKKPDGSGTGDTGNTGTGDNGNTGTGDAGTGNTGTGDNGAGDSGTGNGNASIGGTVVTGDVNVMGWLVAAAIVAAVTFVLTKRKNNKAAGIIGIMALTLIGCGLTIQVSYAAVVNGRFEVSKTITVDGKEKEIVAVVTYGTKVADVDVTGNYSRVSVHDPSIVKDPVTGTYYVFGSHMAWAKSTDLINWETFTNNINRDYNTLFADGAEWSAHGGTQGNAGGYNVSGNLWAPDVIYNEEMGKWCMYMSVNGDHWYTSIALLTADSLEGDWEYVGTVVYSGFTNEAEAAETDLAKVIGTNQVPARYLENRNGNRTYGMNAIDPCVKYDEDGNLWMTYGSWFGGIYALRLDNATGLRDYEYTYETVANVSDEYQGLKLAGGAHVSGEASYIEKIGDYWYLFMSYGGLVANGGYNMRVFRSENITGPYTDVDGNDARFTAGGDNVNGKTGVKIFGNYKWNTMKVGNVAQGHNSLLVDDDGKAYVVYHTRFDDGTEGHQVRVHQLFVNQDGWLVAAPYEYTGETLSTTGYSKEEMAGSYEVLYHKQSVNYANLECVTPQDIVLNNDGTVSGDYTGTWECEADSPYVTMVLGGVEYNGVFVKQYVDETTEQTMCFTLLGDNEVEFWGSKYLTGKIAVDMTIALGAVNIPSSTISDITFVTEGLYGTTIAYSSSDTSVIANNGKVTRGTQNKDVVITATYTNGDYTYEKDYTITVIGKGEEGERILVGEYYTDSPISLKNAAEGTYQQPNPFNKNVTAGLEIYNGVSVEFDVEGKGSALSNIIGFVGGGKLYFTGGSYLGYNATGGYYDANLENYALVTDYINGNAHIRIDFNPDGFEVYSNGALAYTSKELDAGTLKGTISEGFAGYNNVLTWLNNTAETINFGWGNWWNDKFDGTISNVKLYANYVEQVDTSEYAYYQDYSRSDKSEWTSVSAAGAMTIANDGDSRGNYFKLAAGGDTGNRGAYAAFKYDDGTNITGKYTVSMDVSLTAGILAQRSVSVFAILGADASGHTANGEVTSGYILKLMNKPPSTTTGNTNDASLQDTWYINDTSTTVKIPVGEWVTITAEVDTAAGSANVTISKADGTELFADTVSINGSGELYGLQMLRGRGVGTMSVDTIAVTVDEAGGDNPDDEEPPTVTANVSGTAYPDKDSNITVTFTGDKELSSKYPVKINGTAVTKGKTVDMMTVNSITYSGNECTVSLKMSAINGWHSVNGSYDVELMNGSTALASQNVSYSLDLSSDTDYTVIKPSTNNNVKAYYKFDGTKMYVMTVIKGTIHCDGTEAGGTTYAWWNGACSQLYVTVDSTEYSVGSHVYQSKYANGIGWALENHTANFDLINNADTSKVTRSYMALGTFGDDTDTDTGCVLLNVVDFSLAGYTANTLSGKTISFCGFIGPNDNTLRFEAILESETYTIVNGADPIEDDTTPPTVTAQVSGTAYPDKDSNVTVTFTGDKELSSKYPVKINGTTVASGDTLDMIVVDSITYSGNKCTVSLKVCGLKGSQSQKGSYDVEMVSGNTSLAKENISYSMNLSPDTVYTKIKTTAENQYSSAYYKVDGTNMYIMTVIKSDKIHSDSVTVNNINYGWFNCIGAEMFMTLNGTKYNVGSHIYLGQFMNSMAFRGENVVLVDDESNSTRVFTALGTFDSDDDVDTGCIMLHILDLTKAGFDESTLSGKDMTFSGYIGPNDYDTNGDGTRFVGIDESQTYTLQ